jgi:protein tyrosine phosphatase (PTP) superfamily phosphohydrolase (DUF442 family)
VGLLSSGNIWAEAAMNTNNSTDIYNYYAMPEDLGTSGQPTPEQFAAIRSAGFDAVINLAMPNSDNALADEGRLVADQGMTYINIPVPWESPNAQHLQQFLGVMDALRGQGMQVWVHCAANYRASAFTYQYLTQRKGYSAEEASTPLLKAWLPDMDDNWRQIYDMTSAEGSRQ